MARKKILYVESNTDGTVGGSHFSLLFLIEGLNKGIYDPIVLFYQENYLIPRYEMAGCKVIMLRKRKPLNMFEMFPKLRMIAKYSISYLVLVAPLKIIQKAANYVITFVLPLFQCIAILKKEKIDLIHLNNTLLRPQEWVVASLVTGAKVVAHERGINNHFPFSARFWGHFIKAIICISNAVKNNLLKHGFIERQLHLIHNGLDPEKFQVQRGREEVMKELGIADGTRVIGIVGNIKEWKGQETVIRSMTYVKDIYPDIKCLILGNASYTDTCYLDRLKEIVKSEHLENNIIFTGPRKDVPDIVNCLSILIHASIEPEPFGRTLLEGMSLKKPIISTIIGAPVEIVVDGETGILIPPEKPDVMAEAILKILSDERLAKEMGNAGYEHLIKEFNLAKNVELTERLYRTVVS